MAKNKMIALFLLLSCFMLARVSIAQELPKEVQEFKKSIEKSEEEFRQRMRETLRDVKSLRINISFNGDLLVGDARFNFHKELESLVTAKLKKVGIDVKFDENTFNINLETCKRGNGRTFYSILIQFYQPVLVKRKPSIEQNAATWWTYKWDETERNAYVKIKDEVDAITNTFLIDYLLVNPSTTR